MRSNTAIQKGAFVLAALVAGVIAAVCLIMWQQPKPVDFLSFWAAGKMMVGGNSAAIYDIAAHRGVERSVIDMGLNPFPYPPPFALFVAPFGLLPFGVAFTAWILVTGGLYFVAARAWIGGRFALAQPGLLINGFIGQSAFVTSALLLGGTRLLGSRPVLGGALLGTLIVKPQLGLMIPVAMIAGREWRAVGGAISSSAALLAVGWLVLGWSAYQAFFGLLSTYSGYLAASRWPWHELASIFALLRFFAVSAPAALAVHAAVALAAAILVWRAWREDRQGKEAILAAATLLGPPYLLSYEAVLLALPVAWLLTRRPALGLAAWLLSVIPVGAIFGLYKFPNTIPLAALLSMIMIYRTGEGPAPVTER